MPVPYDALRIFLAVAQSGSFSRAARQLGVSQPWVSQRVAQLGHYPIAMEVEHWEVMKTYIALGVGVGLMPDLCLTSQDRHRLRTIPLGPEFGRNHFAIVLRKKKVLSPAALALINVISPGLAQRLAK
ncbi:MAG: LysR family transcriptional regulator [Gemmataceae bacterium]|nr:LysR family transcriptional regulator [Gemmataceae bacterium]